MQITWLMLNCLRPVSLGTVLLGLFAALPVQAQETHIGFVQLERIFREAANAKATEARMAQEFSRRDKDIVDLAAAFKADVDRFHHEAPALPEVQRIARQKRLADEERALQQLRRNFEEDLNARKIDERQMLTANANKVIKQMAEAENFDFIFQDAVYVNPKYDVTDKVIKSLDAQGE